MCRLFGYVSRSATSPAAELGDEDFADFTSLSRVHSDGWGAAWRDPQTGSIHIRKSTRCADLDSEYHRSTTQLRGAAGFVHLRWATGGLGVTEENTHPFLDDNMAFAHNGHIEPIDQLESLLTEDSRSRLEGTTDSERYFQLLRQYIEDTGDEKAGVTRAVQLLIANFPNASLNALLLTPTSLIAIHVNSRADSPQEMLRERLESADAIPARHGNEYYAMDFRANDDCFHVISSGLERADWLAAPPETAAVIDLETRVKERIEFISSVEHAAIAHG